MSKQPTDIPLRRKRTRSILRRLQEDGKIKDWHYLAGEDVFFVKVDDELPEFEFTSGEVMAFQFGYLCSTMSRFTVSPAAIAISTRMLKRYDPDEYEDEQDLPV